MLKKIMGLPQQDTGVGFYRITQPLRFLERQGFVAKKVYPRNKNGSIKKRPTMIEYANYMKYGCHQYPLSGENKMQNFPIADRLFKELAGNADVMFTTLMWTDEQVLKMMNLREESGAKWIVDIDDNMYAVPKDNPVAPDVARSMDMIQKCLIAADGLTVSVPALKEVYKGLNKNIHIVPNGVDFKIWEPLRKLRKKHKKIRIGWEGAYGHQADLELAMPAIKAIQRDYKEVEFVSLGWPVPNFDIKHEFVNMQDYPKTLAGLSLDINLAPLVDSSYNRCKSNLRIIEASALKVPTIYSPTENYRMMPGLQASNNYEWYERLKELIENEQKRKKLGKEAYEYTKKHYDASLFSKDLAEFFQNTKRKTYKPE